MKELVALMDGREAGVVRFESNRLSFTYADSWREAPGAYPISLSMPLAAKEHSHASIEPFLWGLLPGNEFILARWAQHFQVSPRNVFALISRVGEDCAGAVQFVSRERQSELEEQSTLPEPDWLSEADVARRLRLLKQDASAWRTTGDTGQFSLAGAQPKTALLLEDNRWGVPSGRMPTTHILKPPTEGFDWHAENEHLCLCLARALGLPAAKSEVQRFEDVVCIVVTRYDRVRMKDPAAAQAARAASKAAEAAMFAASSGLDAARLVATSTSDAVTAAASAEAISKYAGTTPIFRAHQEDFCQALRVHPSKKYQNEGGPGPRDIVGLLRNHTKPIVSKNRAPDYEEEEDLDTFLSALIFNWLIGGTDAHAKNYSILIGGNGLVRLAPLYDIASIFAYPGIDPHKAKLAMKIGNEYRLTRIGFAEWSTLAAELKLDAPALTDRIRNMASRLEIQISLEVDAARKSGLNHSVLGRLESEIVERAKKIAAL